MPFEKTPVNPLPVGFNPGGKPYSVKEGDDWGSVARANQIDVKALINFNFHTTIPEEVNWYLRRNVGCKTSKDGGKNWAFTSNLKPGVIFIPPAAPAPPRPVMVVPWETLPPSANDRFNAALIALEQKIKNHPDARDWRYRCWFDKLRKGADDRVIEWHRICPTQTGAIGAAYSVGACNLADGSSVDQAALERAIQSPADVEKANAGLFFITFMRSNIVFDTESTSEAFHLENFRSFHDQVVNAITKLDLWANSPMGGSSAMPPAYVSLKDWIGQQQKNPNSVYSCL